MRVRATAVLLLPFFLAGCVIHAPPQDAAPMSPEEMQRASDFDAGRRDGTAAGEQESVTGSFCAGGVVGIALPLVILAVAESPSGGENCGGCGGWGGGGGGGGRSSFAPGGTAPAYSDGYKEGYEAAYAPRRDRAAVLGFLSGLAVFTIGAAVYLGSQQRRQQTATDLGNAGSPAGLAVVRF